MRRIILALPILALAACSTPSGQANYAATIAGLQAGVPLLETAIATYPAANTPAVQKAETDLNAALASLAAAPAPANAQTVLADIQAVAAGLPPGVLSPAHQAEIGAAIALARLTVSYIPPAPSTTTGAKP